MTLLPGLKMAEGHDASTFEKDHCVICRLRE